MQLRLVKGEMPSINSQKHFDDAQLIAAVCNGQSKLAGVFHDRIRPIVERTVHRLLGSSDNDSDDLIQISLIELLRSLGRFRGECSLDTWATTVTSNLVYKHLRRRGLERTLFAREALEEQTLSTRQNPVMRAMLKRVTHHLCSLAPDRAWAFMFHDVYGYSLEEIAVMTGISVAAAQSRLSRGRRELHQRIADDPDLANQFDSAETESES